MDRYPAYKDSEVKWLGEIPNHWTTKRLRHISPFITVGVVVNPSSYVTDHGVPFLFGSEVTERGINIKKTRRIPQEISERELRKTRLEAGDLVTVRVGYPGVTAVVPPELEGANCASIMLIRKSKTFDSSWLCYAMNSRVGKYQVEQVQYGAAQEQFNISHAINFMFPVPPLSEQQSISQYLDRQTAKLDTLITLKQRLLQLLVEKRRALITQAVTRGLNPNVPMHDSEIEWLGNIPEHWSVEQLKYHLSGIEQGWSPQSDTFPANEDEWGVLKVGAVNGWEFNTDENKRVPIGLEIPLEYEIKPGDVLVSRANTTELVGSAALVEQVRPRLLLCDKLYRPKIQSNRLLPEYLVYYLRSVAGRFVFERDATGASGSMQNISQEILANLWITLPPVTEQYEIVNHIKDKHDHLGNLELAAKETVKLLYERRVALISTAVTGQIRIPT